MATATFANPWHDEIGRFAPKGTGRRVGGSRRLPKNGLTDWRRIDMLRNIVDNRDDLDAQTAAMPENLQAVHDGDQVGWELFRSLNQAVQTGDEVSIEALDKEIYEHITRPAGDDEPLLTGYTKFDLPAGTDLLPGIHSDRQVWRKRDEYVGGDMQTRVKTSYLVEGVDAQGNAVPIVLHNEGDHAGLSMQRRLDLLNGVTDAFDMGPIPSTRRNRIEIVVLAKWPENGDVLAFVTKEAPSRISVNRNEFTWEAVDAKNWMPSATVDNVSQNVAAHEYGHVRVFTGVDDRYDAVSVAASWDDDTEGTMSAYGQSSSIEAHAEAFADWVMTGGTSTNPATLTFARKFGWGKDRELALAAAGPPPDDLLDGLVAVMDGLNGPSYRYEDGTTTHIQVGPVVAAGNPWHDELGKFAPEGQGTNFEDYHGGHRPTEEGPRASDLTESEATNGLDVYENPQFYTGQDQQQIRETITQLRKVKGDPHAKLTIYRAAPEGVTINDGDWVTLSKGYAQTHADSQGTADNPLVVQSMEVPAGAVRWAMDDLMEFGYFPGREDQHVPLLASGAVFANPWHDEIGRFAPKGSGTNFGTSSEELAGLFTPVRPLVDALESAGAKTYIVGGSVRDRMIGVDAKDIDIEVHGMSVEDTIAMLAEQGARIDEVGKAFGVLKVTYNGETHDFSFPRTEIKTGEGHTGFDVTVDPNLGIDEALARRDFTINAMAVDSEGNLVDPFNGAADLKAGVLRHVGPAFSEDPLRILRGVQFAARFGFEFAPDTAQLARDLTPELENISIERVWGEFAKLGMKGTSMEAAAQALRDVGLDRRYGDIGLIHEPDLSGLEGDHRAAVALASIGVDPQAIDAPRTVARHMADTYTALDFQGDPAASRTAARDLKFGTFGDAQRIAGPNDGVDPRVLDGPLPGLVDGNDVMARGIRGPAIGDVLRAVQRAQDNETIVTRQDALDWLDRNAQTSTRRRAEFGNPWHDEVGKFAPKGEGFNWAEKEPGMWLDFDAPDGWRAAYDRSAMTPTAQAKYDEKFPDAPYAWQRNVNVFVPGVKNSGKVLEGTARSLDEAKRKAETAGQKAIDAAKAKYDERMKRLFPDGPGVAKASVRRVEFANPWHDEIGEFAPKGTGTKSGGRSSKAEKAAAVKLAQEKATQVPKPTEDDVIQGQVDALLAREGLVRAGGDRRGNNTARKARAKKLAEEFGDGTTCTCPDCGQRIAADAATAKRLGIDALTQDKILVGTLGGSYKMENLIPTCPPCNQSRGDREGVGVGGSVKQKWGSAERFARTVVRAHGDAIAQRFQARRTAILKRKKITWEQHVAKNPDALPQDWDQLRKPVGGSFTIDGWTPYEIITEWLDRAAVNSDTTDHVLRVEDPIRVDIPRDEFAFDGSVVDGVVEIVGGVPPESLGSHHRAVGNIHDHNRIEFANPWHDEVGRFASEGTGVTSLGQDEFAAAVMALDRSDQSWHAPASAEHQAFLDQVDNHEGAFADPAVGNAWRNYAANDYKVINPTLRGYTDEDIDYMRGYLEQQGMGVDKLIDSMRSSFTPPPATPLPFDAVFRGEIDGLGPTLKPGDTFADKGFVSVTENSGSATMFAGEMGSPETWEQPSRTVYVIKPTGAADRKPVVAVESAEQEWVLPPGSKFRVNHITEHAREGYINDFDKGPVVDRIIELEWVA